MKLFKLESSASSPSKVPPRYKRVEGSSSESESARPPCKARYVLRAPARREAERFGLEGEEDEFGDEFRDESCERGRGGGILGAVVVVAVVRVVFVMVL